MLDQELSLLPECQRVVLVLCDLEGLTYEQSAQVLGWPMGTVKSRLARGRDRLRSRLIRRGVAPSLAIVGKLSPLDAGSAKVPSILLHSTVNAAMSAGLSRVTAIAVSPSVLKLMERAMMSILLTNAKLTLVAISIGFCLVATTACFVGPGLRAAAQETRDAKNLPGGVGKPGTNFSLKSNPLTPAINPNSDLPATKSEPASQADQSVQEPNLSYRPMPAPWETVVRIRVLAEGAVRFGSGTVIQSSPEESLILTCARTFQIEGKPAQPPAPFPWRIMVDLFDGKLHGERPAQVKFEVTTGGEMVDFDVSKDVGLIRIRPGQSLPASRVVPKRWEPRSGMKVLTAGCSEGQDATFWNTIIINPNMRGLAGNKSYEATECKFAPRQGRTGGGLFTTDGYIAGVCNFAEPRGDAGLYAAPKSIYLLLDRNGLSSLYQDQSTESAKADLGGLDQESEREGGQIDEAPSTQTPSSRATSPRSTARRQRKPSLRHGGLIFAASPTGNKVIAHNAFTQQDQSVLLNATRENPLEVSFISFEEVIGLDLKGTRITRTAAYDYRAGAWIPLDLSEPVSGELKSELADNGTVTCDAGRHYYTYSTRTGKWDHFDLGTITDAQAEEGLTKPAR